MSIKKQYLKTRPVCKVTFRLAKEDACEAKNVFLVGEFNDWDKTKTPMKPLKDGGFTITLDLEIEKEYQFRYFINSMIWANDKQADKYVYSSFGNCENFVIAI